MEINNYLENVLMSGEEKDTKAKWYYGKIKSKKYYGFVFHVIVDGKNLGSIIPVFKDYSRDDDFINVINESIKLFKRSYQLTMENKLCRQKKL